MVCALLIAPQKLYAAFDAQYKDSKAWRAAFKSGPKAACSLSATSSLCSAGGGAEDASRYATLMVAASPAAFSSLDPRWTGGRRLLGPARDQKPCSSCVAFAVVAALEAAVASTTRRDVSEVGPLSVQQLAFCGQQPRSCFMGWRPEDALQQLARGGPLLLDECLPWTPDVKSEKTFSEVCAGERRCGRTSAVAARGSIDFKALGTLWEVQKHIRQHGAVITRFDIMSDMRPFFSNRSNADRVYSPQKGATFAEGHAVVLVGYNNDDGYWVARNSWGPAFASQGTFKVAFNQAGVLSSGDTYGIQFTAFDRELAPPLGPMSPAPGRPGCQLYTASGGPCALANRLLTATAADYLSGIALRSGVALEWLLAENLGNIKDLDAPIAGKRLIICGAKPPKLARRAAAPAPAADTPTTPVGPQARPPRARGATPAGSVLSTAADAKAQLDALLGIKAALDPQDELKSWTRESGAGGNYCSSFAGVECAGPVDVKSIILDHAGSLGGTLPPAPLLAALPRLEKLHVEQAGISGTLPPGYGALSQLTDVRLSSNALTGQIPREWLRLGGGRLKVLQLFQNQLAGTLMPEAASSWPVLEDLQLDENMLTGTIPREWATFRRLVKLHLHTNKLTGTLAPELSKGLAAVEELLLHRNSLEGKLPEASAWRSMGELSLSFNSFSGEVPRGWCQGPTAMTRLRIVFCCDNKIGGPLPYLAGCPLLDTVQFCNNAMTGTLPEDWGTLKRLSEVVVSNNDLAGTIPPSWGALRLKAVELSDNRRLRGCLPAGIDSYASKDDKVCAGTGLACEACGPSWGASAGGRGTPDDVAQLVEERDVASENAEKGDGGDEYYHY